MSLARRMQRRVEKRAGRTGDDLQTAARALVIEQASLAIGHPVEWPEAKRWLDGAIEAADAAANTPPDLSIDGPVMIPSTLILQ